MSGRSRRSEEEIASSQGSAAALFAHTSPARYSTRTPRGSSHSFIGRTNARQCEAHDTSHADILSLRVRPADASYARRMKSKLSNLNISGIFDLGLNRKIYASKSTFHLACFIAHSLVREKINIQNSLNCFVVKSYIL